MLTLIPLIYIALALVVATVGRRTQLGFWGVLLASLILTPIIVGLGLVLFGLERQPGHTIKMSKPSHLIR